MDLKSIGLEFLIHTNIQIYKMIKGLGLDEYKCNYRLNIILPGFMVFRTINLCNETLTQISLVDPELA